MGCSVVVEGFDGGCIGCRYRDLTAHFRVLGLFWLFKRF